MDNITEREQPKPERIVKLGEEFQLFNPIQVSKTISGFGSSIVLNIDNKLEIPLSIGAEDLTKLPGLEGLREEFLFPFGPDEEGYRIDPADFDVDTRREKRKRLGKNFLQEAIDVNKNSFKLDIGVSDDELKKLGLNIARATEGGEFELSEEELDLLKRLRILIMTPKGGIFDARPDPIGLADPADPKNINIFFVDYYPVDFGPLATSTEDFSALAAEGFNLGLPSDIEKLSQIRAKFALAEERPKDPEINSG